MSKDENDPVCLCSTLGFGDPGVPRGDKSVDTARGEVDARLRLRFTELKNVLLLFSCIELAGELSAGLELLGDSSANALSDWTELCRLHFKRSIFWFLPPVASCFGFGDPR